MQQTPPPRPQQIVQPGPEKQRLLDVDLRRHRNPQHAAAMHPRAFLPAIHGPQQLDYTTFESSFELGANSRANIFATR